MREWTPGELQAMGLGALIMAIFGAFMLLGGVIGTVYSWDSIADKMPNAMLESPVSLVVRGVIVLGGSIALGLFLQNYKKNTGISSRPWGL